VPPEERPTPEFDGETGPNSLTWRRCEFAVAAVQGPHRRGLATPLHPIRVVWVGTHQPNETQAVMWNTYVQDVGTCSSLSLSPGNNFRNVCLADFVFVTGSLGTMKVDAVGRQVYSPLLVARVDRAHVHWPIMIPAPAGTARPYGLVRSRPGRDARQRPPSLSPR
jgi:hypothetical protein